MLAAVDFSHAPGLASALGQTVWVSQSSQTGRFCLAVQPSSVPVPSLAVTVGHWLLSQVVHHHSQAAMVIHNVSSEKRKKTCNEERKKKIGISAVSKFRTATLFYLPGTMMSEGTWIAKQSMDVLLLYSRCSLYVQHRYITKWQNSLTQWIGKCRGGISHWFDSICSS